MSNYQEINPAIVKVKNHKVYYLKINLMILHGYGLSTEDHNNQGVCVK